MEEPRVCRWGQGPGEGTENRSEVPVLVGWALRLERGGEGESSWERQG